MSTEWQSGKTVVSRLRVSGSCADPLETKLQAARLLGGVELCPAGISPSAIVCIRKLRDPLPRTLSLDQHSLRPPPAWQRAVGDAIESLARRAVRPLREFVPANADCVVFSDRAEMLACLAIDWREGQVGMRWWWRSLLPRQDGSRSILSLWPFWLETPEYIPGAWQHLASRGKAAEVAGKMSADETREMLRAITRCFALGDLQAVMDAVDSGSVEKVEIRESYRTLQSNAGTPSMPWKNWAPESDHIALGIEQRCLLGVALTLQRAPTVARTRSFARAARHWFEVVKNESRREPPAPAALSRAFGQSPAGGRVSEYASSHSERKAKSRRIGVSFEDTKADESVECQKVESGYDRKEVPSGVERTRDSEAFESDFSTSEPEDASAVSGVSTFVFDDGDRAPEGELNVEPFPHPLAAPEAHSETPLEYQETAPLVEAQINTNYGGLFYLLNFGLYLELYGDITTPSVRAIPLGVWDFMALVGERLVGSKLRSDPVWALLAQLAGRDELWEPGSGCVMPEQWRMPAQWMEPFERDGVWGWAVNGDRLRLWHPAGFIALDLPLEAGEPLGQLRHEVKAFERFDPKIAPNNAKDDFAAPSAGAAGESQSSLQRWLDWLMPYARARLRRALGLAETDDVGRALCEYRARVFVTATHMDVMLSL